MGIAEVLLLLLFAVLVFLSGFYSGAETAVTSANRIALHQSANNGDARARQTLELLGRMDTLLSTTLVGTNLANAAATTFAGVLLYRLYPVSENIESLLTTLVVTPIILVFGEMVPKALCRTHATDVSRRISGWLKRSEIALYPAVYLTRRLARFATRMARVHSDSALVDQGVTRQDLQDVAELAQEQGVLSLSSGAMFRTVFELHRRPLSTVMVAMERVQCLPETATLRELEDLSVATGFTRFPVYRESPAATVGIVDLRRILVAQATNPEVHRNTGIRRFVQKDILFVSQDRPTGDVIHELHYRKPPLAMVVNKQGDTVGMVTAEDLIEEVVGDLRDERDRESELCGSDTPNSP